MKEKIKRMLIRISYDYRRQKKVEAYMQMKEKYASMGKDELTVEYVETTAAIDHQKLILKVIIILFIFSNLMNFWGGLFDGVLYILSDNLIETKEVSAVTIRVAFAVMMAIIFAICFVLYDLLKTIDWLNRKRLYLEEIREVS